MVAFKKFLKDWQKYTNEPKNKSYPCYLSETNLIQENFTLSVKREVFKI